MRVLVLMPTYSIFSLLTSCPRAHNLMFGLPRCRMYIDGEEDAEGALPKHMLTPGGMVKDVLESQHPYSNNVDK